MSFLGVDGGRAGWFWVHLARSGNWNAGTSDALAAAVAGMLGGKFLSSLPEHPERDSTGLPMQILYYRCAPATGWQKEI